MCNVRNLCQSLNEKTARREFCGPGKRIEKSVMDKLDKDIDHAKSIGHHALKKELKRRQALSFLACMGSCIGADSICG
jgi:hypothetical protein